MPARCKEIMTCSQCNKDKVKKRVQHVSHQGRRSFKFTDENGKLWSGTTCPQCMSLNRDGVNNTALNFQLSHRKCRRCNIQLPFSHYFHCSDCHLHPPSVADGCEYF